MLWIRFEGVHLATAPCELYIALWCSWKYDLPADPTNALPISFLYYLRI